MEIRIKDKLTSKWRKAHSIIFELYEGHIFVYEDFHALQEGHIMPDCDIEICIGNITKQIAIKDGYLYNLESVL